MIRKTIAFVREVRVELGKVSWSSRSELIGSTWVVLISTALLGLVIGLLDLLFTTVLHILLRR